MNQARVRSGMMFAAVPPSWMIPWTRASGRSCCRHSPTELNSRIIASSALWPFHGSDAAWAWRPVKTMSTSSDASGWLSTWFRSQGWNRSAASIPAKRPSSIIWALPLPRSSAGSAEEHDLAGQLVGDRGERDRGADARRGHRVVAAAVTEAGQGVVLGEDPDPRAVLAATAAARRPDRGVERAGRRLDLVAVASRAPRRPRSRPGAPRRRPRGSRGSGGTARGSRPGSPRPRPRGAP